MDDPANLGQYILLVVLTALSAFFSASETAFSSVNKIRLKNYASDGNRKAERALKIAEDFDRMLSAILIGNNIVNIASASIGTVIFTKMFGAAGAAVSTVVMTIVVLIFGEILPKSYAKENSEKVTMSFAAPLNVVMVVLTPLVWIFTKLQSLVKSKKGEEDTPSVTQEELKFIIEEIEDEGVLQESESELLQSALEFQEITVDEILTPRVDLVAADVNDSVEEIKALFMEHRYSRIPIYEKTVDSIIGVLWERDFFRELINGNEVDIRSLTRKTIFVPEKQLISSLMRELQMSKIHMAVVTDSYGGTVGIVTLEDIVEELVGEIWDEKDEVVETVVKVAENEYIVDADLNIFDMLEELEIEIKDFEPESNTVGGWVLEEMKKIPEQGESFEFDPLTVTIEEVGEKRVEKIRVKVETPEPEEE